tara:strand:- start:284 stop:664 length:381 start_codon:yes stop_codon:yes gene_type:complete
MPKRKSKGRKTKKPIQTNRELIFKDDGQDYAYVIRMLGNCRCEVQCMDGMKRLAHVRGKMKNTVWIHVDNYVLVALREFQDEKCDIIHKYTHEEVKSLISYGEIVEQATRECTDEEEDLKIDFDDI